MMKNKIDYTCEFPTSDAYEETIFKEALSGGYFTVVRYAPRRQRLIEEYCNFPDAAMAAFHAARALVYAVNARQNQACIPRKRWAYFNNKYYLDQPRRNHLG